jgi:RNA-directed DNA polymerase
MNAPREEQPVAVAATPQQAGDTLLQQWWWVERTVWTDRMLSALQSGAIKGGKWFRLIDKVYDQRNLQSALFKVWSNKGSAGIDKQSVEDFAQKHASELAELEQQIRTQSYRPHPVRRVYIDKPGSVQKRPLGIPAVRDRVVQTALRHVIEPIFEREFAGHSYGFRPGRGCKDALRRVDELLKAGATWVLDADLKSYFDTIDHRRLLRLLQERIADGRVLELVDAFLTQGVLEEIKGWQPTESGTPQGAVISPLLANIYLNGLDHKMAQAGYEMVRYADDFVILCQSRAQAREALALVQGWVKEVALQLHEEKTKIVDATAAGGFEFLGYHFERGMKWPRQKSISKLKDTLRATTRRTSGESLSKIIEEINPVLRGWFGYFKHSKIYSLVAVDGWVRMRLRSMLRKRLGRKGRGCGSDHQRWPNVYFHCAGLYSLESAWRQSAQPHG